MKIPAQGKLTGPSASKFVHYLAGNETLLKSATEKARQDLPGFIDSVFDIPPETSRAFRKIMTPDFSALLIDFVLQGIRQGELEITAEPAQPDDNGEVAIAIVMEIAASSAPSSGPQAGATKFRVRCKPDDGTTPPVPQ